jgi:hypothetical protein
MMQKGLEHGGFRSVRSVGTQRSWNSSHGSGSHLLLRTMLEDLCDNEDRGPHSSFEQSWSLIYPRLYFNSTLWLPCCCLRARRSQLCCSCGNFTLCVMQLMMLSCRLHGLYCLVGSRQVWTVWVHFRRCLWIQTVSGELTLCMETGNQDGVFSPTDGRADVIHWFFLQYHKRD